jgi:hypothetical protein
VRLAPALTRRSRELQLVPGAHEDHVGKAPEQTVVLVGLLGMGAQAHSLPRDGGVLQLAGALGQPASRTATARAPPLNVPRGRTAEIDWFQLPRRPHRLQRSCRVASRGGSDASFLWQGIDCLVPFPADGYGDPNDATQSLWTASDLHYLRSLELELRRQAIDWSISHDFAARCPPGYPGPSNAPPRLGARASG